MTLKNLALLGALGLWSLGAGMALAQQAQPEFPEFSAADPQRIAMVSWFSEERRKAFLKFVDAADEEGFFSADIEARGDVPFGILLYVLTDWTDVDRLPPNVMPPAFAEKVRNLAPANFRYAIPARLPNGRELAAVFYVIHLDVDATLKCVAEDMLVLIKSGFANGVVAECTKG